MINLLSGSARHQGSAGRYESLSAAGYQQPNQRDIDSYYLLFDDQKFEASGGPSYRSYSFPVRCLVYLFVRSGGINLNKGLAWFLGNVGINWSNTAVNYFSANSANSYWFEFKSSESRPSHGPYDRWFGLPVRCLVILVSILYFRP